MFSPSGIYFVKIFLKENFTKDDATVYLLALNFHRFLLEIFNDFISRLKIICEVCY